MFLTNRIRWVPSSLIPRPSSLWYKSKRMSPRDRIQWVLLLAVLVSAVVAVQTVGHDTDQPGASGSQAAASPASAPNPSKVATRIIDQTNAFRQQEGLQTVALDEHLGQAAHYFAQYLAQTDTLTHTADGNPPSYRAKKYGYAHCVIAENIAYRGRPRGYSTSELADRFVAGWKNSPGHRKNMLDQDVLETGVAVARSPTSGRYYAVQMFGRPRSERIVFKITNQTASVLTYSIGGKTYALSPHHSRTHARGRPPAVELKLASAAGAPATTKILRPANGMGYVVQRDPAVGYSVKTKSKSV